MVMRSGSWSFRDWVPIKLELGNQRETALNAVLPPVYLFNLESYYVLMQKNNSLVRWFPTSRLGTRCSKL
jgi:hypothetical protein